MNSLGLSAEHVLGRLRRSTGVTESAITVSTNLLVETLNNTVKNWLLQMLCPHMLTIRRGDFTRIGS